jgi:hypothetical protein
LTAAERARLAVLADILIPAGDGFPSASAAGAAAAGLDSVLELRPDLAAGLRQLLHRSDTVDPGTFVAALRNQDPSAFQLLGETVASAYFLHPDVRRRLNYTGQGPKPIDPTPHPGDDDLLRAVVARGPIYRPTPASDGPPSR